MALSVKGVWDVRRSGLATNSSYFNPSNPNFATDLVATSATFASPVVSSPSYQFVLADVNHWLFLGPSATWNYGYFPIVSVSGGQATINAAAGAWFTYDQATGQTGVSTLTGCATVANATGGVWGVDYTRSDTPRYSFTDLVINGTTNTNFTSAAFPVGKNFIGNSLNIASGTGFTVQTNEVLSTAGTVGTCDKSLGTLSSTGGVAKMGGAYAHPSNCQTPVPNSGIMMVKYSPTYYAFPSGLTFNQSNLMVVGYDTTRTISNNDANRPIFQPTNPSVVMITCNSNQRWFNLDFQNPNAFAGVSGINGNNYPVIKNCRFNGFQNYAITMNQAGISEDIELVNCGTSNYAIYASAASTVIRAIAKNCGGPGGGVFYGTNGGSIIDSVCYGHTTNPGFAGFGLMKNCIAHSGISGASGFGVAQLLENCISFNNNGADFGGGSSIFFRMIRCFYGKVPTNYGPENAVGCAQLTGDPCNNAAGYDFTLNNTTGAGALVRALIVPFPDGITVSRPDAGAAQSAPAAPSGGQFDIFGRVFIKAV